MARFHERDADVNKVIFSPISCFTTQMTPSLKLEKTFLHFEPLQVILVNYYASCKRFPYISKPSLATAKSQDNDAWLCRCCNFKNVGYTLKKRYN